jgi:hypothetical protein
VELEFIFRALWSGMVIEGNRQCLLRLVKSVWELEFRLGTSPLFSVVIISDAGEQGYIGLME